MKRILVCGPIFNTPSGPAGMGGILYTKLKEEGYVVYRRSAHRNKLIRLIDILYFVLFKKNKYDIILLQTFSNLAFLNDFFVTLFTGILKKPTVSTIHGGAFIEFYTKFPKFTAYVLNKSAILTSPSHFLCNHLNAHGHKVRYIPNFIEIHKFPYNWKPINSPDLLWVRAFTDIYKPEMAIKLVARLKTIYPQVKLTMVGPDMGKMNTCKDLIKSLDLSDNIVLTGKIPNNDLNKYYATHSVYINTTSYESFGVALVEAACSGIPVVTTEVGEIPFMWQNNEDMLLVKDNDEDDFFEKVKMLLINKELQMKLSQNARLKAENYSWDNVKYQWKELI